MHMIQAVHGADLSEQYMANCAPSLLKEMSRAVAFAFAHAYRSVSRLEPKDTCPAGNSLVDADQYSITPALCAEKS